MKDSKSNPFLPIWYIYSLGLVVTFTIWLSLKNSVYNETNIYIIMQFINIVFYIILILIISFYKLFQQKFFLLKNSKVKQINDLPINFKINIDNKKQIVLEVIYGFTGSFIMIFIIISFIWIISSIQPFPNLFYSNTVITIWSTNCTLFLLLWILTFIDIFLTHFIYFIILTPNKDLKIKKNRTYVILSTSFLYSLRFGLLMHYGFLIVYFSISLFIYSYFFLTNRKLYTIILAFLLYSLISFYLLYFLNINFYFIMNYSFYFNYFLEIHNNQYILTILIFLQLCLTFYLPIFFQALTNKEKTLGSSEPFKP